MTIPWRLEEMTDGDEGAVRLGQASAIDPWSKRGVVRRVNINDGATTTTCSTADGLHYTGPVSNGLAVFQLQQPFDSLFLLSEIR